MKVFNIISILAIIAILLLLFVINFLFIRIEVGETGVRTLQYGLLGEKGVEKRDFGPGWHRDLPLLDTWNVFDTTVQTTEFTDSQERNRVRRMKLSWASNASAKQQMVQESIPATGPERIELKSEDGYTIYLDVTVKYRIMSGEVHNLYQKFNNELRYKGIVRDQVQKTLRDVFGTMRTEQFYNPEIRREKTEVAAKDLEKELKGGYVELVDVLIRDIRFDASYEQKILDKKLADQDAELKKSETVAAEKKGETQKIEAETEAKVLVINREKEAALVTMKAETERTVAEIRAKAELKAAQIQADAKLYEAEKLAAGDLLEKTAEAEGEKLKAAALDSSGGANLVALQAIQALQLGPMRLSTIDQDFLDVDWMIDKLGAE